MSRDVVTVAESATADEARTLLLEHDIRTLPVLDAAGHLSGTVGLRELAAMAPGTPLPVSQATTAKPSDPAIGLLPRLTDGSIHAVVILDDDRHVVGIISQTDLLATLAKSLSQSGPTSLMGGHGQGI
jgi:CBS domain-containing membrane protein